MSQILLDTHALIWIVRDDPALSKTAIKTFQDADQVFCSVVSIWEIAIKRGKDPHEFPWPENWRDLLGEEIRNTGMILLGVEMTHCGLVEHLPRHHKDPFDRMLIAQAQAEGLTILTKDPEFQKYGVPVIW